MAKQKNQTKLGKGLAALMSANTVTTNVSDEFRTEKKVTPRTTTEQIGGTPLLVSIDKIIVNTYQPRKIFKEKDIAELCESIKENGIIQPIIVTQHENEFQIISGERRWRAARKAGLEQVPVIVKRVTDRDKLVLAIIENVQRSDLNCVEEALAYYQLMDDFQLTQEEVAKKVGKERSSIANFLRILKLPREVVELLQKEELSFGHGKVLAAVKDTNQIVILAHETVSKKLSVRQLESLIKQSQKPIKLKEKNDFFDEKLDAFKNQLEKRTGFHFKLSSKGKGSGEISIKFNDEAEFNDVIEYLLGD